MSMNPEWAPEFDNMDGYGDQPFHLMPVFSGEAFQKTVPFPVIVEGWEKKNSGRVKRRWLAEFTPSERKKLSGYHGRFYRWYLISGVPRTVTLHLRTLELLQKAVNFFGSI
jgi:hypothetical protein